jgi:hypothetical protein
MITVTVDQASVTETIDHLEAVRKRIFIGVKQGMREAMEGLAGVAVAEMGAAGIENRTGELAENILKSPRIWENAGEIGGTVKAKATMKLKGRSFEGYLGTALDEGFHVKAVDGNLFRFTEPDADTLYARGHAAFDVKPHPFLQRASESFAPSIIDIIQAAVNAAIAGDVA